MLINNILKTTVLSLVLAATTMSGAWASGYGSMRTTHLMETSAYPLSGQVSGGTHKFRLHVGKQDLKEMRILFPNGIRSIREIEVTNDQDTLVKTKVSINEKDARVIFVSPVSSDTILSVKLKGVNTNKTGGIWQYRILAKLGNFSQPFPLGIARIHTYKD